MIPPSRDMRQRSIRRWLTDQRPQDFKRLNRSGALESTIAQLDETMIEAFETKEDAVMHRLMASGGWGTQATLQEFQTQRLMLWSETRDEFLPVIIDLE